MGIGTKLVTAVIKRAKDQGLKLLGTTVNPNNPESQRLLRKLKLRSEKLDDRQQEGLVSWMDSCIEECVQFFQPYNHNIRLQPNVVD
jgi:RimJ/RimL family protein N-acetyltransferase